MRRAVGEAVAALAARDRLRLGCYYGQDLTLAQIGRTLGEHEATVSRHLARARREIREHVERELRERERNSDPEIATAFRCNDNKHGSLEMPNAGHGAQRKTQDRFAGRSCVGRVLLLPAVGRVLLLIAAMDRLCRTT